MLHQRRLGIDLDLSRRKGSSMKIVVIGGTGLIGSETVAILRQDGHKVVAASPQSGINTITGEGLKEAMVDTTVVIDLATRVICRHSASLSGCPLYP